MARHRRSGDECLRAPPRGGPRHRRLPGHGHRLRARRPRRSTAERRPTHRPRHRAGGPSVAGPRGRHRAARVDRHAGRRVRVERRRPRRAWSRTEEPEPTDGDRTARRGRDGTATMRVVPTETRLRRRRPPSPPPPTPVTWVAAPGDSMWRKAESVLADAWHRTPSDREVVGYWQALVDANRTQPRRPGQRRPDLRRPVVRGPAAASDASVTTWPATMVRRRARSDARHPRRRDRHVGRRTRRRRRSWATGAPR